MGKAVPSLVVDSGVWSAAEITSNRAGSSERVGGGFVGELCPRGRGCTLFKLLGVSSMGAPISGSGCTRAVKGFRGHLGGKNYLKLRRSLIKGLVMAQWRAMSKRKRIHVIRSHQKHPRGYERGRERPQQGENCGFRPFFMGKPTSNCNYWSQKVGLGRKLKLSL